jgi:hypothetical protein
MIQWCVSTWLTKKPKLSNCWLVATGGTLSILKTPARPGFFVPVDVGSGRILDYYHHSLTP